MFNRMRKHTLKRLFYSDHRFPTCSVLVLDFVWERFHNTSPGDLGSKFIKAKDSEMKDLEKQQEPRQYSAFAP